MYTSFYGLQKKPFNLTPDPKYLFRSSVHKRGLAYLEYGLKEKRDVIVISGEVGSGKTTLIRVLLDSLDPNIKLAWIINPLLSPNELLKMILHDVGLDVRGADKADMLNQFNDYLVEENLAGNRVLLIIDEAQNLSPEALEEVRLLSNLETEEEKLLQILLVGQPELRDTLSSYELRQLNQRISLSYHLTPLSPDETRAYVVHRLQVAGIEDGKAVFTEGALKRIASLSGGIPRLVNIICDAALLAGFVDEVQVIDEQLVSETSSEIHLNSFVKGSLTSTGERDPQGGKSGFFPQFQQVLRDIRNLCEQFPIETHLLSLIQRDGSDGQMKELIIRAFGSLYQLEQEFKHISEKGGAPDGTDS